MILKNTHFCIIFCLLISLHLFSAEVDQFTKRYEPLEDISILVNHAANKYLKQGLANLNQQGNGCNEKAFYKEMKKYFHNHISGKLINEITDMDVYKKEDSFIKDSIYREWGMWDGVVLGRPGAQSSPLAMAPIIKINNMKIGLDKLEHMFDRGYAYFKDYYYDKTSIEEVLINGLWWEKALFGGMRWGTGIVAYADLASNFNGMRFWNDFLKKHPDILGRDLGPYVICEDNRWELNEKINFANYVDESFDEGINCSEVVGESTRKKIEKQLKRLSARKLKKYTCPMNRISFDIMKWKYGYFSKFILNGEGIRVSDTMTDTRKRLGLSRGWKDVPKRYLSIFKRTYDDIDSLQYKVDSRYIRKFRIKKATMDELGREYRYEEISYKYLKIRRDANPELKSCFYELVSGGDCQKGILNPLPASYTKSRTLDLLKHTRDVSRVNGLVAAKREFLNFVGQPNEIRERVYKTTADKDHIFDDSVITIPEEERSDIGVFFCLGIGSDDSPNSELIRRAAKKVSDMGFYSKMLEVSSELDSAHNAIMIRDIFQDEFPKLKKVILVGASKGVADYLMYLLNYGETLSANDREKLKLVVSLSGVVRGSFVADYIAKSKRMTAVGIKTMLKLTGKKKMLKGILSLSIDPWEGHKRTKIKTLFPSIKWISFPAVPEGEFALTNLSLWSEPLKYPSYGFAHFAGPGDGLVESAASILPPDTKIEEYIIPILGPHAMALGSYQNGSKIAPVSQRGTNELNPESGPEILDAYFRALPVRLLD